MVIRIKSRLDPGYDAAPSGGRRDLQMLCLLRGAAGGWRFAELQANARGMVELKGGSGGGGHDVFNEARLIDAFSPRSPRRNGKLSDEAIGMIENGVALAVGVPKSKLTPELEAALSSALEPPECRLRELGLGLCKPPVAFVTLAMSKLESLRCVPTAKPKKNKPFRQACNRGIKNRIKSWVEITKKK